MVILASSRLRTHLFLLRVRPHVDAADFRRTLLLGGCLPRLSPRLALLGARYVVWRSDWNDPRCNSLSCECREELLALQQRVDRPHVLDGANDQLRSAPDRLKTRPI